MTPIKFDKRDRDAIAAVCMAHNIEIYFMENIRGDMQTAVIYCDSPSVMFYLGRSVQIAVEMKDTVKL